MELADIKQQLYELAQCKTNEIIQNIWAWN